MYFAPKPRAARPGLCRRRWRYCSAAAARSGRTPPRRPAPRSAALPGRMGVRHSSTTGIVIAGRAGPGPRSTVKVTTKSYVLRIILFAAPDTIIWRQLSLSHSGHSIIMTLSHCPCRIILLFTFTQCHCRILSSSQLCTILPLNMTMSLP